MQYTFQYSYGNDNRIAVSDWIEKTREIEANSLKEAVAKGNRSCQNLGTWLVLDCYPSN